MRWGSLLLWWLPVAAADGCDPSLGRHLDGLDGAEPGEVTLLQQGARLGRAAAFGLVDVPAAVRETAVLSEASKGVLSLAEHDAEMARRNEELSTLLRQALAVAAQSQAMAAQRLPPAPPQSLPPMEAPGPVTPETLVQRDALLARRAEALAALLGEVAGDLEDADPYRLPAADGSAASLESAAVALPYAESLQQASKVAAAEPTGAASSAAPKAAAGGAGRQTLETGLAVAVAVCAIAASFTMLEADEPLWDKFKDDPKPNVFGHLSLASDGGFTEVTHLYSSGRWAGAAMLVAFVLYNVVYVAGLDLSFMADPMKALIVLGGTEDDAASVFKPFYFCRVPANVLAVIFTGDLEATINPVRVIGALELLGLVSIIIYGGVCVVIMIHRRDFRRWFAVSEIFWYVLPTLSTYSSLKLLNFIVPSVFAATLFEVMAEYDERKAEGKRLAPVAGKVVVWLLKVVFAFCVGFDTFLMKMRVVSVATSSEEISMEKVSLVLLFIIQALGIVQLGPLVRKRLFVFIFGGEDGVMQNEEVSLMNTWNALLARRMYDDLPFARFLAVISTFTDEDFQKLVLNENQAHKEAHIGS